MSSQAGTLEGAHSPTAAVNLVAEKPGAPLATSTSTALSASAAAVSTVTIDRTIPEATVARLAVYLRVADEMLGQSASLIASSALAAACGVNPAKLRKDLSFLGSIGTRGVGYELTTLRDRLAEVLGMSQYRDVVIVGVGHLGHALAGYGGLAQRGFRLVGLFDIDRARIGERIADLTVAPLTDLASVVGGSDAPIGLIATPAEAAQAVAVALMDAGVTSILNFASTMLDVPAGVDVRKVDLATELQILSFHQQRRSGARIASGGSIR
ncbi:MAG: redox-sensing transcriptional repressor Rex [Antricoccus sp.]